MGENGIQEVHAWVFEISKTHGWGWVKPDGFGNVVKGAGLGIIDGKGQLDEDGEFSLRKAESGRNEAARE